MSRLTSQHNPPPCSPPLSPGSAVGWLVAAGGVALLGSILLEGARLVGRTPLAPALGLVLPLEIAVYLLALRESAGPVLEVGKTIGGLFCGLLLRAGLALGAGGISSSALAPPELGNQFLLYYVQLWPGVAVQIAAVAVLLWLLRDLWAVPRGGGRAGEQTAATAPGAATGLGGERRRALLAALLEPEGEQPSPRRGRGPEAPEAGEGPRVPPISRRSRRAPSRAAQPPLPAAESPSLVPDGADVPASAASVYEPSAEETASLPQVSAPAGDQTPPPRR